MMRSVQLALFVLLSYQLLSLATGFSLTLSSHKSQVANFCSQTHAPRLCMASTKRFSASLSRIIDAQAVLKMQLRAISNRCWSARKKALKLAKRARGPIVFDLKNCAELYNNAVDLTQESIRALNANDGQSAQTVQIMLQEVRQSAQECDMQLKRGFSNPLAHASGSIVKMTVNGDDLNNIMAHTTFHKH